jgi:hypothetical protein
MTNNRPPLKPHIRTIIFIALCMVLAYLAFAYAIETAKENPILVQ